MFYVLSKVLLWLLQPLALLSMALAVALIQLRRGRAAQVRRLIAGSLGLVIVTGVLPLSNALILPLEQRFGPAVLGPDAQVDGIVVLGGGEESWITQARGVVALGDAGERLTEAMVLARRHPQAKIAFSGGAVEIVARPTYGSDAAELFFHEQGLDMRRLVLERQSRNTHENATMTKALVRPRPGERWLLVTSAFHMPRAMGCFRQAGWEVLPWPVDYRTVGRADLLVPFANPNEGIRRFEVALKEWVGLVVYRLSGRSASLFPGPAS